MKKKYFTTASLLAALVALFSFQNCARDGKDGKNAEIPPSALTPSCTLQTFSTHAVLSCIDGSNYTLTNGTNGTSCTVAQTTNGATITCTDGTTGFVANGQNGSSCTVIQTTTGSRIQCPDGSSATVLNGLNGDDGSSCSVQAVEPGKSILQCGDGTFAMIENGKNGLDGSNGSNGSSCSTVQTANGAQIQCADGTFAVISNGQNGQSAAATGYEIVKVIDPCGTKTAFDEVLLKFANGDILAHYATGTKQHFSLIPPGKYMTTDGTNCTFTVTEKREVVW